MENFKKSLICFVTLILVFSVVSCGGIEHANTPKSDSKNHTTKAETRTLICNEIILDMNKQVSKVNSMVSKKKKEITKLITFSWSKDEEATEKSITCGAGKKLPVTLYITNNSTYLLEFSVTQSDQSSFVDDKFILEPSEKRACDMYITFNPAEMRGITFPKKSNDGKYNFPQIEFCVLENKHIKGTLDIPLVLNITRNDITEFPILWEKEFQYRPDKLFFFDDVLVVAAVSGGFGVWDTYTLFGLDKNNHEILWQYPKDNEEYGGPDIAESISISGFHQTKDLLYLSSNGIHEDWSTIISQCNGDCEGGSKYKMISPVSGEVTFDIDAKVSKEIAKLKSGFFGFSHATIFLEDTSRCENKLVIFDINTEDIIFELDFGYTPEINYYNGEECVELVDMVLIDDGFVTLEDITTNELDPLYSMKLFDLLGNIKAEKKFKKSGILDYQNGNLLFFEGELWYREIVFEKTVLSITYSTIHAQ